MMSHFRFCPSNLQIPALGKIPTSGQKKKKEEEKMQRFKAIKVMPMSRKP